MRKIMHKWFWVWDYEKEEKWLNEMAAAGLALISASFCRYEFEECVPGAYELCIVYTGINDPARVGQLVDFIVDTGAEHVGSCNRWLYFRRPAELGKFEMYSDNASRAEYISSIKKFLIFIGAFNLFIGFWNISFYLMKEMFINLIGLLSIVVGAMALFGAWRMQQKIKALHDEGKIFE